MSEEQNKKRETLLARTNDLQEIMSEISYLESIGEPVPHALSDKLTNALTAQSEKIDRCVIWVGRAKAEIEWLKNEKKSIDAQIKRVEASIKRMNELADFVMKASGEDRLSGMHHYFRKQSSTAVKITDESLIPEEFKSTEIKTSVDKSKLLQELRSGKTIPGAELEERVSIIPK